MGRAESGGDAAVGRTSDPQMGKREDRAFFGPRAKETVLALDHEIRTRGQIQQQVAIGWAREVENGAALRSVQVLEERSVLVRRQGVTGENMLRYLELRLDNVVYRAGWAATRPQARQLVNHGHVDVTGRRVNIPSYRLRKGDTVTLRPKTRDMVVVQWNLDVLDRQAPAWIDMIEDGYGARVRDVPMREQIDIPIREQLIVELYSK